MSDVLVVGTGLLGTSIGLALQGSRLGDVTLHDRDPAALAVAVRRGAGRLWDGVERAGLAVVAVPPAVTAATLVALQKLNVAATYTHVASVQSHVQAEIETSSSDPSVVVGGHPLAGREVSGPESALADLFVGRPWAVCPARSAQPSAVAAVEALARACAGTPHLMDAAEHDRAVALLSHLPHVVASALAGALLSAGTGDAMVLAGPGLVDTTRLAAGDADLWLEILEANAAHVAPAVAAVGQALTRLAAALDDLGDPRSSAVVAERARHDVHQALRSGNAGRALVPVKRGETSGAFASVRVQLQDRPGQLAALLHAAGEAAVNVEDVRVEHVPGRPTGLIELVVAAEHAAALDISLRAGDWTLV